MSDNTFLFDDYFIDDADEGIEIGPVIKGHVVPMRVKRGIQYADRSAAQAKAMQTVIKPNGAMEVVGVDQGVFGLEVLVRSILKWPFVYSDGRAVPITRDNISKMLGAGVDAILMELQQIAIGQDAALVPSESPSGAA